MKYAIMVVSDDEHGIGAKVVDTDIEVWGDDAAEVLDLTLEQLDRYHEARVESGESNRSAAKIEVNRVTADEFGPRVFDEEEAESPRH